MFRFCPKNEPRSSRWRTKTARPEADGFLPTSVEYFLNFDLFFSFVNQNPTFKVLLLCFCKSHRLRNFWIFWFISASYIRGHIVTTRASWDQLFSKKALFNLKQLILCDRSIFWMAKPDLQMGPIGLDDLEYSRCCTRKGNLRTSACSFEDRSSL